MSPDELKDLQSLFQEEDPQIADKRVQALQTIRENDISSFPSDLSILSAFDDVLQCFALGGQIRNFYRYGTYTTCDSEREKLWFALFNGTFSEGSNDVEKLAGNARELERRKKVQNFYKQKLFESKLNGSSEDVWDERKKLLVAPFKE